MAGNVLDRVCIGLRNPRYVRDLIRGRMSSSEIEKQVKHGPGERERKRFENRTVFEDKE
jgi:hypothetical protein